MKDNKQSNEHTNNPPPTASVGTLTYDKLISHVVDKLPPNLRYKQVEEIVEDAVIPLCRLLDNEGAKLNGMRGDLTGDVFVEYRNRNTKKKHSPQKTTPDYEKDDEYIQAMLSGKQSPLIYRIMKDIPDKINYVDAITYIVDRLPPNALSPSSKIRHIVNACVIALRAATGAKDITLDDFATTLIADVTKTYIPKETDDLRGAVQPSLHDDEFKYSTFRANQRRKQIGLYLNNKKRTDTLPTALDYRDTLDPHLGKTFRQLPKLNLGIDYLRNTNYTPANPLAIGYRKGMVNSDRYNAYTVAEALVIMNGMVMRHNDNGRRHSRFNISLYDPTIYRINGWYLLGVVLRGNFYPIYLGANTKTLYLSRVPLNDFKANLFNFLDPRLK